MSTIFSWLDGRLQPCEIINSWLESANYPPYYYSENRRVWEVEFKSSATLVTGTLYRDDQGKNKIEEIWK